MLKTKIIDVTILLLALLIIPSVQAYAGTPQDHISIASPIWSDRLGTFSVLVASSDDGRAVVAASDLGVIRMYDQTGKTLWTYNVTGKATNTVAISGNGENVAAGFMDPYQPNGQGWVK